MIENDSDLKPDDKDPLEISRLAYAAQISAVVAIAVGAGVLVSFAVEPSLTKFLVLVGTVVFARLVWHLTMKR